MLRFVLARGASAVVVLLLKAFVIFGLIGLMPGDPVDLLMYANPDAKPEDVAHLRAMYGVDQSILARFADWLWAALHGDFGYSRALHRPVLEIVLPALGNTLLLTGTAFALATVIAVALGTVAAVRHGSWLDRVINLFAYAGISIPGFWLGLVFVYIFAVRLGWLPASGMPREGQTHPGWTYVVMPVATLVIGEVGGLARYTRSAILDVLGQDHVRTAHAKGLSGSRVVLRHVLRNGLIPIVTVVALGVGHLFSGALLIEVIFAWRGMGRLTYEAIMGNDYNLALICLLFTTMMILLGSLLADLAYAWLDPRIGIGGRPAR
jgi:peptide/nickel transport system permease protein